MDCVGKVVRARECVPAIKVSFAILDAVVSSARRIVPFHAVPQAICARDLTNVSDRTKVTRG